MAHFSYNATLDENFATKGHFAAKIPLSHNRFITVEAVL